MSKAPCLPEIGVLAVVRDGFDDPWQSRHQILTRLSHYFHVVWVEPAPKWRDARRGRWRARVWAPDDDGAHAFVVYKPGWLPFLKHSAHLARLVERMRLASARRLLGGRGCKKIVLSLWRPRYGHALTAVPHDLAAYHIDDEYTFARVEGPPDPREVGVIEAVDVVSVHSPGLMLRKGHINPRTVFIPNGVDYATYAAEVAEPADLATIRHPRIGYTGYLKSQLDWPLIHQLVVLHPEWNFVFVGPQRSHAEVVEHVEALARVPNAHFLGAKKLNELAAYPQHFDVCIMPYRIDDYTKCIYPLKLHEYLATGRPVVGARILSLEDFADVVTLASTTTEWSAAIADALEPAAQAEPRRLARQEVARRHDWDTIARRMAQIIAAGFGLPISWGHSEEAPQE